MPTHDREADELADAWLRAEGLGPEVDQRIHPDDEMYSLEVMGPVPVERKARYLRSGYEGLLVLENALRAVNKRLADAPLVLDFACGYGRVLRFLRARLPAARVHASEILEPACAFVGTTFGVHTFPSVPDPARLLVPARYDVIWVGSLFSHLPAAAFEGFLRRLFAALTDDGVLVLSTHPREGHPETAAEHAPGLRFFANSECRVLPRHEYGTTFTDPATFARMCAAAGIAHWRHLPFELWGVQDVYLVSRSPFPAGFAWPRTVVARGFMVERKVSATGHAWVGGYVRIPKEAGELAKIELLVGESATVETRFRPHQDELPLELGGRVLRQLDWYTEGSIAHLTPGFHPVVARARFSSGTSRCFAAFALWR